MTEEYCPWCREKQPVIETVDWQANTCSVCSQAISASDSDARS